ncbi:Thoeris anti-defense Tad2 family protein [Pseudoalteromonas galatheae]|uniref:Thoeris anti-defense Tad2 family protein n=1 Tax=Pseudoalteromonas galatheae TaxID=579562 RepID=UPI0030D4230C
MIETKLDTTFVGLKVINAWPMTYGKYLRYMTMSNEMNINHESLSGYLVEYEGEEGGDGNHPNHKGYVSWSPEEPFDKSYYNVNTGMPFEAALLLLKRGKTITRKGWQDSYIDVLGLANSGKAIEKVNLVNCKANIWTPTFEDLLADDWVVGPA